MTPTDERMNSDGTVTTMTVLVEEDRGEVQEFIKRIQFVEFPHKFVLGSLPTYELKFYSGEKQLEMIYIESTGVRYFNWVSPEGSFSELTPESSRNLRRWLEERGVVITD